jgi:hypothetical protein
LQHSLIRFRPRHVRAVDDADAPGIAGETAHPVRERDMVGDKATTFPGATGSPASSRWRPDRFGPRAAAIASRTDDFPAPLAPDTNSSTSSTIGALAIDLTPRSTSTP